MKMKIRMELSPKQLKHIQDSSRKLMITGSAGSGKTLYGGHKCILYALQYAGARCYVFRQTLTALRVTIYREIIELLDKYGIEYEHNKAEFKITLFNDSTIEFKGLDDLRKIRSINADFILIEQAEETNEPTYRELEKRLRGKVSKNYYGQMILIVQPESTAHYLYNIYYKNNHIENTKVIHFSYKDNPYLPEEYIMEYDTLRITNPDLYRNYTLGEWIEASGAIYNHYDYNIPDDLKPEYYLAGVDFGFVNPSAFIVIGIKDSQAYILGEVYKNGLTNKELIKEADQLLKRMKLRKQELTEVLCDSAEPDRIKEFQQEGYRAISSDKSVSAGINSVKATPLHINEKNCPNTVHEIKQYSYRKDKDGNELEEPIKINDHSMDAIRYALHHNYKKHNRKYNNKIVTARIGNKKRYGVRR